MAVRRGTAAVPFISQPPGKRGESEKMKENKNGFTRREIDDFYNKCPERCEVMEYRKMITDPQIRYITVKMEYVYK